MTTITIKIPDELAAALSAKAVARGLTLENWFQEIAEKEASRPDVHESTHPEKARGTVVERMRDPRNRIPPDPEGWTTVDYVNYGRALDGCARGGRFRCPGLGVAR